MQVVSIRAGSRLIAQCTPLHDGLRWRSFLARLLKPYPPSCSFEFIRMPPAVRLSNMRNPYVPISRMTILRELLKDASVINPNERDSFEEFASELDVSLNNYYRLLQKELRLLSLATLTDTPNSGRSLTHHTPNSEQLDHQFWLLRRVSELAPVAGFIEVNRDQFESACNLKRRHPGKAVTYIDPNDYSIIRFWICGVHPSTVQRLKTPNTDGSQTTPKNHPDIKDDLRTAVGPPMPVWFNWLFKQMDTFKRRFAKLYFHRYRTQSLQHFCLEKVLMAVQTEKENILHLRLFKNVPFTADAHSFAESLGHLPPILRFHPLGFVDRVTLLASSATALGCLGLISPMAYILASDPNVVLAWSLAASASAFATLGLVWTRRCRAQTVHMQRVKQLYYECGMNSDAETVRYLLKMAFEEEFKSTLLTYALLLRPSETGSPINTVQLGVRAGSWISKRLSPQHHATLPPDSQLLNKNVSRQSADCTSFGSVFSPERSLTILRRLNLVQGPPESPQAIPVSTAVTVLREYSQTCCAGMHRLWSLDPIADDEKEELVRSNTPPRA